MELIVNVAVIDNDGVIDKAEMCPFPRRNGSPTCAETLTGILRGAVIVLNVGFAVAPTPLCGGVSIVVRDS